MNQCRYIFAPLAVLLTVTLAGCGGGGPTVGRVTGTVMVDGKPATGVNVNFQPADGGRGSSAVTDENGQYDLIFSPSVMGALVGTHTVRLSGGEPPIGGGEGSEALVQASNIPQKYLEMEKSVVVEEGSNTHDLTYP